jgi:AcrR family transcriptional regulator
MPQRKRPTDEPKRDVTRRLLLERALELFQKRGVEATTMRAIAKASGLSLGAAYYYFPSKDALVFAFYEDTQIEMETMVEHASGTLRERLGALFHRKLEVIGPQRKMLATIVHRLIDPADPVSAFSQPSRAVRDRAVAVFERTLGSENLPPDVTTIAARALWLLMLSTLLVYMNDRSRGGSRTHQLVDDALDMIVPLVPLLATPIGRAMSARVSEALTRAGML